MLPDLKAQWAATLDAMRQDEGRAFVGKSEAARRLAMKRSRVYEMIARGEIPVDEHGRIPRDAFNQLFPPC